MGVVDLFGVEEVDVELEIAALDVLCFCGVDVVEGEGDESPLVVGHGDDEGEEDEQVDQRREEESVLEDLLAALVLQLD